MASIIKVDTIQTAAGGTPTAADLGINTTGTVLQVVNHKWNDSEAFTSASSWTDSTGSQFTFTPKSSNSNLLLIANVQLQVADTSGTQAGGAYRFNIDGTAIDNPTDEFEHYDSHQGTEINFYWRSSKHAYVSNTSTSAKTIKLQAQMYDGNQTRIRFNTSGAYYSYITVWEIAG